MPFITRTEFICAHCGLTIMPDNTDLPKGWIYIGDVNIEQDVYCSATCGIKYLLDYKPGSRRSSRHSH